MTVHRKIGTENLSFAPTSTPNPPRSLPKTHSVRRFTPTVKVYQEVNRSMSNYERHEYRRRLGDREFEVAQV